MKLFLILILCEFFIDQIKADEIIWKLYRFNHDSNHVHFHEDEAHSKKIFFERFGRLKNHNSDRKKSFKFGVNKFFHLEYKEFEKIYLPRIILPDYMINKKTYYSHQNRHRKHRNGLVKLSATSIPDSVDWVNEGKVAPVKDQKNCGCCYSFAAVSIIESLAAIKFNQTSLTMNTYSEQHIIDCTFSKNIAKATEPYYEDIKNDGCSGGNTFYALNYAKYYGVYQSSNYSYRQSAKTCSNLNSDRLKIKNATYYLSLSDTEIMKLVAKAPVGSFVNVNEDFLFYSTGVFESNGCNSNSTCYSDINHAITIVGYGTEGGVDYWLVRNSWGKQWGEDGYMRMIRGKNMCCINGLIITGEL